jgi:TetR/AcrR family transcriptional repressor of nem operon
VSENGSPSPTTQKGRATRERIVAAAAELMYRHGVAGSSTPALREAAGVSSSQIYHYFADKDDLTRAVVAFQTEAILEAQTPMATLRDLDAWRDNIVAAAGRHHGTGGCPLGSLSSELADTHPWAREQLATGFSRWAQSINDGLTAMVANGTLRADTDTQQLALALLATMQGGLLLAQAHHTTQALQAGLDTVIQRIRDHATAAP